MSDTPITCTVVPGPESPAQLPCRCGTVINLCEDMESHSLFSWHGECSNCGRLHIVKIDLRDRPVLVVETVVLLDPTPEGPIPIDNAQLQALLDQHWSKDNHD